MNPLSAPKQSNIIGTNIIVMPTQSQSPSVADFQNKSIKEMFESNIYDNLWVAINSVVPEEINKSKERMAIAWSLIQEKYKNRPYYNLKFINGLLVALNQVKQWMYPAQISTTITLAIIFQKIGGSSYTTEFHAKKAAGLLYDAFKISEYLCSSVSELILSNLAIDINSLNDPNHKTMRYIQLTRLGVPWAQLY